EAKEVLIEADVKGGQWERQLKQPLLFLKYTKLDFPKYNGSIDPLGWINRYVVLQELRERLLHAQNVMKTYYDSQHRDVSFDVGDMVLLKLQPYRQVSVGFKRNQKLAPRFYGPFPIIDRIGLVDYKLHLPEGSKLHPVFHVSCLKKFHGTEICSSTLPLLHKGVSIPTPQAVLDSRIKDGLKEILIHWEGLSPADASWESAEHMQLRYPQFALEDKRSSKGRSD
ncbi:Unknown protein, partial [Striga hermonthica]